MHARVQTCMYNIISNQPLNSYLQMASQFNIHSAKTDYMFYMSKLQINWYKWHKNRNLPNLYKVFSQHTQPVIGFAEMLATLEVRKL